MSVRFLAYGDRDLLVELDDADERGRYYAALQADPPDGVRELVPAAVTVLVRLDDPSRLPAVKDAVASLRPSTDVRDQDRVSPLEVPVRYDGDDLAEVAGLLELSPESLVRRHQEVTWQVEFVGFSPGFGYLTSPDWQLDTPRRASPRTRIPAGAVALAGSYTGAYPQPSPGGWQLIGTTHLDLWDSDREEPALFVPGRAVRFVEGS